MKIVIGRQYEFLNKPPYVKTIDLLGVIISAKSDEDVWANIIQMTYHWLKTSHKLDKAPFFKPSDCGVITIDNIETIENRNFISPVAIECYNNSMYFVSTINVYDGSNTYIGHRLIPTITDNEEYFKWDITAITDLYDLFKKS